MTKMSKSVLTLNVIGQLTPSTSLLAFERRHNQRDENTKNEIRKQIPKFGSISSLSQPGGLGYQTITIQWLSRGVAISVMRSCDVTQNARVGGDPDSDQYCNDRVAAQNVTDVSAVVALFLHIQFGFD